MVNETEPIIRVRTLHFRYPDGTPGLGSVDLDVERGARFGLMGPNGSGKSTLLHHIAGVYPAPGHLWVCGVEASRSGLAAIRRRVGFLFQDPDDQLFLPTVGEDLAFGLRAAGRSEPEIEAAVTATLGRLGIAHLVDRPTHRLSGGEKQGVALASALVGEPEILALDEPTNDLDPGARRRLLEFLRAWEGTVLVATHDLEFLLELGVEAVILDGGAIVARAPAEELLSDRPLLERHGLEEPASLRVRREVLAGNRPSERPDVDSGGGGS